MFNTNIKKEILSNLFNNNIDEKTKNVDNSKSLENKKKSDE